MTHDPRGEDIVSFVTNGFAIGLQVWLALLAMIIALRMWNGGIDTTGFLRTKRDIGHGAAIEPERLINLIVFPIVIATFTYDTLRLDPATAHSLPDISNYMLTLLTGGNSIYLAGKIARTR